MTVRTYLPPEVEALDPFVQAGVVGPTEVHALATYVAVARATGSDVHPDVQLALALAVRAPLHGHVCVDLFEVADTIVTNDQSDAETEDGPVADGSGPVDAGMSVDEPAARLDRLVWPEPTAWLAEVAASPLVRNLDAEPSPSAPGGRLVPFVLEHGRVYLARFWVLERYVAADLRQRSRLADEDAAGAGSGSPRTDEWAEAMTVARATALDLFPDAADTDSSQRDAVLTALDRDFVVVAGGPGTGKTHTVARLLAAVMSGLESVDADLQVALVAPTGKASARMSEAIRQSIEASSDGTTMPVSESVRARLAALEATTIHRLLGRDPEGGFRHGPEHPLPHDIVVVDEVSMVSLSLIAHLLAAVRPSAKVVLVGDPYQLASVEAGAVLGDIVGLARSGSAGGTAVLERSTDGGSPSGGISSSVRSLAVVHRQGEGSPIRTLADAIRDDRADEVVELLRSSPDGIAWIDPSDDGARVRLERRVETHAREVVAAAAGAAVLADPAERAVAATRVLEQLNGLKVLSALRRGRDGVDGWNRRIDQRLRSEIGIGRGDWYTGRPVMVTRNDYVNHVFNGDVGVALAVGDRFQVWFPRSPEPLVIEATRLDDLVTQWAMSIHKSQGSEFAHVVVTLPPPPSRILTRELLYTAVTRAKSAVTIMASEASIREAIARPVARASGLAVRLAAE